MISYGRMSWPAPDLTWQTLIRDSYHPDYLSIGEAYHNITSLEAKLDAVVNDNSSVAWQATLGGELVGLLLASAVDQRLVIYDLFISPSRQRSGIGRALVKFAIADVGALSVAAEVYTANRSSLALFEKLGFQPRCTSVWLERKCEANGVAEP